jgi:hypothetical protein
MDVGEDRLPACQDGDRASVEVRIELCLKGEAWDCFTLTVLNGFPLPS